MRALRLPLPGYDLALRLGAGFFTLFAAYLSVRFLVRWFRTRTLTPFAIYCLVVGAVSAVHFSSL